MVLNAGRTIGAYTIQKQIGQGGMGVVYTAFQHNVGRTVALKVLATDLSHQPDAMSRFQREVAIIAQLEHPHILPVYDFGEVDNNPYIVMRYMRGGTLADVMDTLTLPKKLLILQQIAEALEAAHKWQIVHRDLKPGNILLDEVGNAYLADFGLAKSLSSDADLTATGGIVGTPAYMSPEQARGESLDASTDIYSLAVMTYQLLSGQHPFPADNPVDYLSKHLIEPPPYISILLPTVPHLVEAVLRQGLAKERHERPLNVTDLIAPIVNALKNVPSLVPITSLNPLAINPPAKTIVPKVILAETVVMARPIVPNVPKVANKAKRWGLWMGLVSLLLLLGGLLVWGELPAFFLTPASPLSDPITYRVGKSPRALLYSHNAMWVVNGFDNSLSQLVATQCTPQNDPCGQAIATYPVSQLPVSLAATEQAIWIAGTLDGELMALDPQTGDLLQTISLTHLPTRLLVANGFIWILNEFAHSLTKYDPVTKVMHVFPLAETPQDFVLANGFLWVTHTNGGLWQLDPQTGAVVEVHTLTVALEKVVWDGKMLWLTAPDSQQLLRFDVGGNGVSQIIELPDAPMALTVAGDFVWVTTQQTQVLLPISLNAGIIGDPISTPNGGFALHPVACGENCFDLWAVGQTGNVVTRWRWVAEQ